MGRIDDVSHAHHLDLDTDVTSLVALRNLVQLRPEAENFIARAEAADAKYKRLE